MVSHLGLDVLGVDILTIRHFGIRHSGSLITHFYDIKIALSTHIHIKVHTVNSAKRWNTI